MYPFFCAFNFFYYLCVMENKYKTGKHILDNHIKAVKKLTKDTKIKFYKNEGYYFDDNLKGAVVKIKSIRKYKHRRIAWTDNQEQYVYEVDVIVDMRISSYYYSNNYCTRHSRRCNGYFRGGILGTVLQELKYFSIDGRDDVNISKIEYKSFS